MMGGRSMKSCVADCTTQRWIYRIDPKRVNEYGQVLAGDVDAVGGGSLLQNDPSCIHSPVAVQVEDIDPFTLMLA